VALNYNYRRRTAIRGRLRRRTTEIVVRDLRPIARRTARVIRRRNFQLPALYIISGARRILIRCSRLINGFIHMLRPSKFGYGREIRSFASGHFS